MTTAVSSILAVEREAFTKAVGDFQGFRALEVFPYSSLDAAGALLWWPRDELETDEEYKQLIPYVVLGHRAANSPLQLFAYRRTTQGGEARLHGRRSIGFCGPVVAVA